MLPLDAPAAEASAPEHGEDQQHDHDDDEQGVVIHDGDSIGRP